MSNSGCVVCVCRSTNLTYEMSDKRVIMGDKPYLSNNSLGTLFYNLKNYATKQLSNMTKIVTKRQGANKYKIHIVILTNLIATAYIKRRISPSITYIHAFNHCPP